MAARREIGVALVGGGLIAKAHAAGIRALPVCFPDLPSLRPRVVCDVTLDLAEAAAARLGFEEATVGWQDVVTRDDVEAVIVATPPDLHRDVAIGALRAGKHVLCEKPLARTAAEAREMLAAAEAVGTAVVSMVGFSMRQTPALLQARRLVAEGALGDVLHVSGRYFQDHGRDASRPLSWRYQAAKAGSGALADVGSHLVDSLAWLVGEDIAGVQAVTRTVVGERPQAGPGDAAATAVVDVDDYAAFLVRFASGALGTCEVSRVATGRKNQMRVEVNGRAGSLTFDWQRGNELSYASASDPADRQGFRTMLAGPAWPGFTGALPVAGIGVGFLDAFTVQAATFAAAIAGEPPVGSVATFRDGLRANLVIDAALESARTSEWVTVPSLERVAA